MATTRKELILRAVKSILELDAPTAYGKVYRSRAQAFTRLESPAILILPEKCTAPTLTTLCRLTWTLSIVVHVITRGNEPDAVADPIVDFIHKRLMANRTLSNLASDTNITGMEFELLEVDQTAGITSMTYDVIFQTSAEDLSSV